MRRRAILIPILITAFLFPARAADRTEKRPIKTAVIGGMIRTGLWKELARRFEAETGYRVEIAVSGNRDILAEAFRAGKADLVTMQAGEVANALIADGTGQNMRDWARNEFVIIGPKADPAGIRGMRDGATALRQIADRKAMLVDYQNSGPRDVVAALWKKAGISPQGDWMLKTESGRSEEALEFARGKQAYLVLGRVPSVPQGMEILVQGDPEMHRLFVVMEANPKRFPEANSAGARAFAEYLLSAKAQDSLLTVVTNTPGGMPLFYPVKVR